MLLSIFRLFVLIEYVVFSFFVTIDISYAQNSKANCHCNEEECAVDPTDGLWKCPSWTCAKGWYRAPFCDRVCEPLSYGVNCEKLCHCPLLDTCDSVSGVCKSGVCHEYWYGPSCQIALPGLIKPPTLRTINCTAIEVTWNRWNVTMDDGAENTVVHSYTVRYCESTIILGECDSGGYTSLSDLPGSARLLVRVITGLKPLTGYLVQVVTNRDDFGKKVQGRSSQSTYSSMCMTTSLWFTPTMTRPVSNPKTTPRTSTTTTTPPLTTQPAEPLPLTDVTLTVQNSTHVGLSWRLPSKPNGLVVTGVLINVTGLRYIACANDSISPETVSTREASRATSAAVSSLAPHSDYELAIVLEYTRESDNTVVYSDRYVDLFTTQKSAPTEQVADLSVGSTGATWLMIGWSAFPCYQWNSEALTEYELETSSTGVGNVKSSIVASLTSTNISSLLPNVRYGIRIRPNTRNFNGVWSGRVFATTLNAVPPEADVKVSSTTDQSITISITQPQTTISIDYYNVTLQKRKAVNCVEDSPGMLHSFGPFSLLDGSSLTQTLPNLEPYTLYDIQVINVNEVGITSTSLSHSTLGVVPQEAVTIADSNSITGQVNFIWQRLPCEQLGGELRHYEVQVYAGGSLITDSTTPNLNYTVESPTSNLVYRIRVRVINDVGAGPWSDYYNVTSTIVRAPSAVTNLRLTESTANSLKLSWELPSLDGNQAARYRVRYELLEIGDCGPVTESTFTPIELEGQPTEYNLRGLKPWAKYRVTIDSWNNIGTASNQSEFSTDEAVPSDLIVITSVEENTGTSAKINWLEPSCEELRGPFREYQYRLDDIDGSSHETEKLTAIGNTSVTVSVLPNRRYEFRLRIRNSVGRGDYSLPYSFRSANIAPLPLGELTAEVDVSSMTVKWSRQQNDIADAVEYNISLATLRLGSCSESNADHTSFTHLGDGLSSYVFTSLHPYTLYSVLLVSANDIGSVETSATFTTLPKTPDISVRNLRKTGVFESTLVFAWNHISCDQMTGKFMHYTIQLTSQSGVGDVLSENLTDRKFTASELRPYTEYVFSIALQLEGVALSPPSTLTVSTLETVPSAIVDAVRVRQTSPSVIEISWDRPAENTGELLYWRLNYTVNWVSYQKNVSAGVTSYTLSDVLPHTNYTNIVVWGVGTLGDAPPSPAASFLTNPQRPGAPVQLQFTSSNLTCLKLAWSLPAQPNGIIESYKAIYTKLAGPGGVLVTEDSMMVEGIKEPNLLLCGLDAGSQYTVTVSAFTVVGEGPGVSSTGWTMIGAPPAPNTPELLSKTESTITLRLSAVTSVLGPITFYEIWVAEVPTSSRRKRNLEYQKSSQLYAKLKPSDFNSGYYDFVVGDNRSTFGLYLNRPLKEAQQYDIYHVVLSVQGEQTEVNSVDLRASTGVVGLTTGWVVAIACIALVVVALIIIISLLIWCRMKPSDNSSEYMSELISKHGYQPQFSPLPPTKEQAHSVYTGYWSSAYKLGEDRHIVLDDVEEDLDTDKPLVVTFQQEFNSLPRGQQYPWTEASKHPELNRVSHLVAYDRNRVKLKASPLGVDYINATYIDGYAKKCSYIATTSPFNEDCTIQFWQMVYEQEVSQIVMMTNMMDEGIVKCVQYWPEHVGEREIFGHISVELIDVEVFANFTIYRMKLSHDAGTNPARDVVQYHYTSWPAHGVPHTTFPILDFRLAIRSMMKSGPLVVHCGTGSSTTGFFIAVDYLIDEADANANNINTFHAVSHLRESRSFLVRTQKQYLYIYDCLFEYLLGGDKILSQGIKSKFRLLTKANRESGQRYFAEEMMRLNKFTPNPTSNELTAGSLDINRCKNRYSDDASTLPTDLYRVKLSLEHGTSDYINAVFLDGYHQRNAFIITQTPLHETVVDFWRMIYEQGVSTIVMMDGADLQEETCAQYWPSSHQLGLSDSTVQKSYGEFDVQLYDIQQLGDVCVTREMTVTNRIQPSEPIRHVKQFQVLDWFLLNRSRPPKSGRHMLTLMDEVDDWKRSALSHNQTTSSPVVVHCLNGATHSAVFPAVSLICEKMAAEGHVNIFLTVKEIKHRKKDALISKHQYKYLHTVLRDYINRDMPGGGDYYQQPSPHRHRDDSTYNNDSYESYNDDETTDEQMNLQLDFPNKYR